MGFPRSGIGKNRISLSIHEDEAPPHCSIYEDQMMTLQKVTQIGVRLGDLDMKICAPRQLELSFETSAGEVRILEVPGDHSKPLPGNYQIQREISVRRL